MWGENCPLLPRKLPPGLSDSKHYLSLQANRKDLLTFLTSSETLRNPELLYRSPAEYNVPRLRWHQGLQQRTLESPWRLALTNGMWIIARMKAWEYQYKEGPSRHPRERPTWYIMIFIKRSETRVTPNQQLWQVLHRRVYLPRTKT